MTTNRLGGILRENGRCGLRYERLLRHRLEEVWRALTESDALRHWMPTDIVGDRRTGAELTFPFWPDVVERCEIPTDQVVLSTDPLMAAVASGTRRVGWAADCARAYRVVC